MKWEIYIKHVCCITKYDRLKEKHLHKGVESYIPLQPVFHGTPVLLKELENKL